MSRRVLITGVGPVSAMGVGVGANWEKALAGESALAPIRAFDASEFACSIAGEVRDKRVEIHGSQVLTTTGTHGHGL